MSRDLCHILMSHDLCHILISRDLCHILIATIENINNNQSMYIKIFFLF